VSRGLIERDGASEGHPKVKAWTPAPTSAGGVLREILQKIQGFAELLQALRPLRVVALQSLRPFEGKIVAQATIELLMGLPWFQRPH